jgi:beta-lactam-binding protein with PASTA domain
MARRGGEPPAAHEQAEVEEATTQADSEWPVAPQYQVAPSPEPDADEPVQEAEESTVAVRPPSARSFYGAPLPLVLLATLAFLLLAGAASAWLVTRPEGSTDTPAAQGAATSPPRNTPSGDGGTKAGATTTGTSTTETTGTRSTTTVADTVTVPDVLGLKASTASRQLRAARLVPRIRLVTSARNGGTVVDQQPAAGQEVATRSTVIVEVTKKPSKPAPPVRVTVPSLVGLDAAAAKDRLRALGLHWSVATEESDRERGTVVAQSPSARSGIEKGGTVALTVSSGPAAVAVPDVTGLDEADARARLENAGFLVDVVDQPAGDPSQAGVVVDQNPAGGASAEKSSTVTITVARA